ncbi:hypothetical protein O6P43_024999 [Quillaja saponaria]|uniref:Uncharacterized protein n=1 Tax=Quillaja saponaria TaxID=32244 RepID=A0AAD7L7Y0_QUISA|nr:hypothetical protein O6P43_024999 [Quillaja saponaria]
MDNMEARIIRLDSSLQEYKASMNSSFQKLKLGMKSKFQALMGAIDSLAETVMEVHDQRSEAKLQTICEKLTHSQQSIVEENQNLALANPSTFKWMNDCDNGTLKLSTIDSKRDLVTVLKLLAMEQLYPPNISEQLGQADPIFKKMKDLVDESQLVWRLIFHQLSSNLSRPSLAPSSSNW